MSDELSREQLIDQLDRVADKHIKIHRPLMIASIIAHDALQRETITRLQEQVATYAEQLETRDAYSMMKDTISRLEDRIDLQCDEFQRISALTENDEVKGLCARAVKDIRQHVPVIQQRDTAEQQVARLREAHEEVYQVISLWFKYFNSIQRWRRMHE